jgi:hypothetical protein
LPSIRESVLKVLAQAAATAIATLALADYIACPASADYYVVQDTDTHKCTVEPRPTKATNLDEAAGLLGRERVLGPATGYKTREEAIHALKIAKACESR